CLHTFSTRRSSNLLLRDHAHGDGGLRLGHGEGRQGHPQLVPDGQVRLTHQVRQGVLFGHPAVVRLVGNQYTTQADGKPSTRRVAGGCAVGRSLCHRARRGDTKQVNVILWEMFFDQRCNLGNQVEVRRSVLDTPDGHHVFWPHQTLHVPAAPVVIL